MRLKSLSGLTADEKRAKMRAMAEELQKVDWSFLGSFASFKIWNDFFPNFCFDFVKVTPEATAEDIKRWMIDVVQQHNQQKLIQQQHHQLQQQQQAPNPSNVPIVPQPSRIVDGRLHAELMAASASHAANQVNA